MKIISHRGFWQIPSEKNTLAAFRRSLDGSFGFETDIRDYKNKLTISHDVPESSGLDLIEVLNLINENRVLLTWNVKADGLISLIQESFSEDLLKQSVFFDMSIPETLNYKKNNLPYLVRMSEYEILNNLYDDSNGVWIDSFESNWFDYALIEKIINDDKYVIIVSAELHKRDNNEQWNFLRDFSQISSKKIVLCTDYPTLAKEFFDEKN